MFPRRFSALAGAIVIGFPYSLSLAASSSADPGLSSPAFPLPVTQGLIRWWPNLFDVRDEITGQEGVVMGLLPPVQTGVEDDTEFSHRTGWVQLRPAITNEVSTFAFWVICRANRTHTHARLLAQEIPETQWIFQTDRGDYDCFIAGDQFSETDAHERVTLGTEIWRHVAIARRADGTCVIWLDGQRAVDGRIRRPWPATAQWLVAGNGLRAAWDFLGGMMDLCVYDRVLSDAEVQALHQAGFKKRPARNTAARLAATIRPIPCALSTDTARLPRRAWIHQRFTTEDGLPGNVVKAVLQASNGYLWVATDEGLARFDGRVPFREFTAANAPALEAVGSTVFSLAEDSDGTIWAGTFGGLLRVRDLEFTAFTNGLPQRYVLQVHPVGDGSLLVAGFNNYIPRGPCWLRWFHPETGTSSAEVVVPGHLRRLVTTTNGFWLAAEQPQQLYFWDGQSPAATVVGIIDDAAPGVFLGGTALPPDATLRAWSDPEYSTNCWAEISLGQAAPRFYWHWDQRLRRPWTARWTGPVNPNETWLGVGHDLARLREGALEKVEIAERAAAPEIACLTANREGGVWFGTEEDGLHLVRERLIYVHTTADGLTGNDVRSVCATPDGGLWVGTSEALNRWSDGRWSLRHGAKLSVVASDRSGEPWGGLGQSGQTALYRTIPSGGAIYLGIDWQDPNTIRFARDGTLWAACERGLTWLKPERLVQDAAHNWIPDPGANEPAFGRYVVGGALPDCWPLGIVEDRDGSIWMGSLGHGLFRVAGGNIERFSDTEGLPGKRCLPVYWDDSDALWIITQTGLSRRKNGRFQHVSQRDGLPGDVLLDLIQDDLGNFWISGKRGLHRVARQELEAFLDGRLPHVQAISLGVRDGLITPECSSMHYPSMAKTPDGNIWVATRHGLARLDPRRVRMDTAPLPSLVESLFVNRRETPIRGSLSSGSREIVLPPGSGQQLEFRYTAVSLIGADRVRFSHRLVGYDSEWSPATDLRLAVYTNLRPGRYRFEVKAANPHGIWNEVPAELPLVVRPFFWQTNAFYGGLALALLGTAGGLHYYRLRTLRRFHEMNHRQSLAAEKARIAADMHDDLGATLTQISILGEVAKRQALPHSPAHATLERIAASARDLTQRISELVWATNPRNDTLDNLVAYLREHAAAQLDATPIQAQLEFPAAVPDRRVSAIFRRNLLLVIKESLNNAIKHSGARRVSLRLEVVSDLLHLRIADDGAGFDPAQPPSHGNGLGNMERRIRDLRGGFTIQSAPGQGVRIDCRIPLADQ